MYRLHREKEALEVLKGIGNDGRKEKHLEAQIVCPARARESDSGTRDADILASDTVWASTRKRRIYMMSFLRGVNRYVRTPF